MSVAEEIRDVLSQTLQLGDRGNDLTDSTLLLGNLPELDSMMIATLLAAIEERFDISIEDDEISAETFESVGSLRIYVEAKLAA
ncbi:MAG TPA: acyl carrier protein [Alphaproteobacteria bacterium]|nr:acyl carrier protein [Alphaproteobacteria bacterium]